MKKRFRFNLTKLRNLPPAPPGKRVMYHDTKYQFLKCRVTNKGIKSLIISARVNGHPVKKVVYRLRGEELDPQIDILRKKALEEYKKLEESTKDKPKMEIPTFGEYVKVWAQSAEMRTVTESWRKSKLSVVRIHCGQLLPRKLDSIGRGDVRQLLNELSAKGLAGVPHIVRSIIKQVFELAIDDGVLPDNFAVPLPLRLKLKRNKRERRLSRDELRRLFYALSDFDGHDRSDSVSFRLIVLLALFTAQRRGNILKMRWDEIDMSGRVWVIPGTKTKTRREYRVGLHEVVGQLLQVQRGNLLRQEHSSPWVFPSYLDPDKPIVNITGPWSWLVKNARLEDFRFHDLRHSAASIAYENSQDLKGTQLFLQHADSRTTADRYIHTVEMGPQIRASGAVIQALIKSAEIKEGEIYDFLKGNIQHKENRTA